MLDNAKDTAAAHDVSCNSSIIHSVPLELLDLDMLFDIRSMILIREDWPDDPDKDDDSIGRGLIPWSNSELDLDSKFFLSFDIDSVLLVLDWKNFDSFTEASWLCLAFTMTSRRNLLSVFEGSKTLKARLKWDVQSPALRCSRRNDAAWSEQLQQNPVLIAECILFACFLMQSNIFPQVVSFWDNFILSSFSFESRSSRSFRLWDSRDVRMLLPFLLKESCTLFIW